jgi:hypothetical protein
MADKQGTGPAPPSRSAPEVVAPSNKVNVALPFSKITVEEPSREFAELSAIVAALAAAMERVSAEPDIARLRRRADVLAARSR